MIYRICFAMSLGLIMANAAAALEPLLHEPDRYQLELFLDLGEFDGHRTAVQMQIVSGRDDFPDGLYFTSGMPSLDAMSVRGLFRLELDGELTELVGGLDSCFSLVFARGEYGEGILYTEPTNRRVSRLAPDGTVSDFVTDLRLFALEYGPDGYLYASGFADGTIHRILPSGETEPFATVPLPQADEGVLAIAGVEGLAHDENGHFGGGLLASTFSLPPIGDPSPNLDRVFKVSEDGLIVDPLTLEEAGLPGVALITLGPGGAFGHDLYVAAYGTDGYLDGGVYAVSPEGEVRTILTQIDAEHVVFDEEGLFGGGMLISDWNGTGEFSQPGRIWRLTPLSSTLHWSLMK